MQKDLARIGDDGDIGNGDAQVFQRLRDIHSDDGIAHGIGGGDRLDGNLGIVGHETSQYGIRRVPVQQPCVPD